MKLILFDIDGTLMTSGRAARDAVGVALDIVFGTSGDYLAHSFDGKTDPQIFLELMQAAGFDAEHIRKNLKRVYSLYLEELGRRIVSPGAITVFPGVRELLDRLRTTDAAMGLLTGNIEEGARLKLRSASLLHYFAFGAFSDCTEERGLIAEHALEVACASTGTAFDGKDTVVVGDSIHDIGCARRLYARSVAVATGKTSAAVLNRHSPDFLFADFSNVDEVLEAMLG